MICHLSYWIVFSCNRIRTWVSTLRGDSKGFRKRRREPGFTGPGFRVGSQRRFEMTGYGLSWPSLWTINFIRGHWTYNEISIRSVNSNISQSGRWLSFSLNSITNQFRFKVHHSSLVFSQINDDFLINNHIITDSPCRCRVC